MAYNKTAWKAGDIVTSALLNKIEQGITDADAFDLSDRIAKGVDANGDVVAGAIAEGAGTTASGVDSHAEGMGTTASGSYSHAEGVGTTASRSYSHAEGAGTTASGDNSHAEGGSTTASGNYSHAEGAGTTASSVYSHAEGYDTAASGSCSHAEGSSTIASSECSHAEGYSTTASGACSHAEGYNTTANHKAQHVFGEYNIVDTSSAAPINKGRYIEIVGNGNANTDTRSNARTLDWSGNEWIAGNYSANGSLTLGKGTNDEVTITAAQLTQLLALLS